MDDGGDADSAAPSAAANAPGHGQGGARAQCFGKERCLADDGWTPLGQQLVQEAVTAIAYLRQVSVRMMAPAVVCT